MHLAPGLIAVDWGTTNRRIYRLDADGAVLASERDGKGILSIPASGFPAEVAAMRARFGDLPMLLAGMVGSARGWANVPYLSCPAGLPELAGALFPVEAGRCFIVPGLSDPHGDVMRGEEVQMLGAAASGMVPQDSLLCQPGTHCKWAHVADGRIMSFSTAITGELFALLREHSLLAEFMADDVAHDASFEEGAAQGLRGGLLSKLFGVRASALLGLRPERSGSAFVSGLIIGADVGERQLAAGQRVYLLADPHLGRLYARAISLSGGDTVMIDSQAAFVAGATRIWRTIDDRIG